MPEFKLKLKDQRKIEAKGKKGTQEPDWSCLQKIELHKPHHSFKRYGLEMLNKKDYID